MPSKILAPTSRQPMNWDARSVGAYNRSGLANGINAFQHWFLDFEIFSYRLDNPISLRQPREMILQIAQTDKLRTFRSKKCRRLATPRAFQTFGHDAVSNLQVRERKSAALFFRGQGRWHNVQQIYKETCIGKMRRNG